MTENEGRVYGLDNVALDLPLAGVGSRILAGCLDYMIVGVVVMIWFVSASVIAGVLAAARPWAGLTMIAIALLGMFLIEYGYFAGFEIGTGGRTPGKMVAGLTVVTHRGAHPTWGALLARNLVRTVDLLIGVPLMALDPACRRLGDRLAGTLVVYQEGTARATVPLERVPRGWSAQDIALAESFLAREADMDRDTARGVAERLVAAIRRDDPSLLASFPDHGDASTLLRRALSEKPS